MREIQAMVGQVLGVPAHQTAVVAGSGTLATEAALSSLLGPGDRAVVCVQGYFSQRLADVAKASGACVHILEVPPGQASQPLALQQLLDELGPVDLVAAVHGETATGVANDILGLGQTAQAHGALFVVDCVSTFGGYELSLDGPLDVVCGAGQKCLGAYAGLSPLGFSKRAMMRLASRTATVHTWYGDLTAFVKDGQFVDYLFRVTGATVLMAPLHEALRRLLFEGVPAAAARHAEQSLRLQNALEAQGWRFHQDQATRLNTLLVVQLPPDFDESSALRFLANSYGLAPGKGMGSHEGKAWRIGVMAEHAQPAVIDRVILAFADLRQHWVAGNFRQAPTA